MEKIKNNNNLTIKKKLLHWNLWESVTLPLWFLTHYPPPREIGITQLDTATSPQKTHPVALSFLFLLVDIGSKLSATVAA